MIIMYRKKWTPPTKNVLAESLADILFNTYKDELTEDDPNISYEDISLSVCKAYHMKPCKDDFDVIDRLRGKLRTKPKDWLVAMSMLYMPEDKLKKIQGRPLRAYRVYLGYDPLNVIETPEHKVMAISPSQALMKALAPYSNDSGTMFGYYKWKMMDPDDESVVVEIIQKNPKSKREQKRRLLNEVQTDLFEDMLPEM